MAAVGVGTGADGSAGPAVAGTGKGVTLGKTAELVEMGLTVGAGTSGVEVGGSFWRQLWKHKRLNPIIRIDREGWRLNLWEGVIVLAGGAALVRGWFVPASR
jgi:hypothetical protein